MPNFTEKVTIEVIADTKKASDDIGDVKDDLEEISKKPTELEVTADTDLADRALLDVQDDIKKLKDKIEINIEVNDEAAKRSLRSINDDAKKAGAEGGGKYGESFIRDVGGVFGGTNATALGADLAAGIETGFAAIGKESMAGPLIAALGIGAVAVTAAQTIWGVLNSGAENYKKALAEAREVQKSLFAGERLEAVTKFKEQNEKLLKSAQDLAGLDAGRVFAWVQGADDPAIDDLVTGIGEANAATLSYGGRLSETQKKLGDFADSMKQKRKASQEDKLSLDESAKATLSLLKATGATNDELMEFARTSSPAARREIVLYIAAQNGIPKEVVTQFGSEIDDRELAQVKTALDNAAKDRTTTITPKLNLANIRDFNRRVPPEDRIPIPGSASTQTTVINNYPPTLSPVKVQAAVAQGNARNGALKR